MAKYKVDSIVEFLHFDSLNEMVRYCDDYDGSGESSSRTGGSDSFYGTSDYKEASDLVRNGWPEGVRSLERALSVASDGMDIFDGKEPHMDVCGPIPITGAFCSGDPECMLTPAEPEMKPVINLVFDANATSNVSAAHMRRRGAAILALAQKLEESGRSVAIYASVANNMYGGYRSEGKRHLYMVCLKKADAEMNIHTLAYALAHASFFRRHGFRILEKCKKTEGYGASIALTSIEGIESVIGDLDLYFQCANTMDYQRHFRNQEAANDYVIDVAKKAGVIS